MDSGVGDGAFVLGRGFGGDGDGFAVFAALEAEGPAAVGVDAGLVDGDSADGVGDGCEDGGEFGFGGGFASFLGEKGLV